MRHGGVESVYKSLIKPRKIRLLWHFITIIFLENDNVLSTFDKGLSPMYATKYDTVLCYLIALKKGDNRFQLPPKMKGRL